MAKLTKVGLKKIVKECLVEILSEGLMSELSNQKTSKKKSERHRLEEQRLAEHRKKFDRKVEDTVSSLTDDSVLQDILRDTAKNTLQEQMENSNPLASSSRSPGVDISQIFSGASQNWEELAFSDKKRG